MGRNAIAKSGFHGPGTLPLSLSNSFEERDRNQPSRGWNERIASLIPLLIILATDDMEKIAFCEPQLLSIVRVGFIVVERLDYLLANTILDGRQCSLSRRSGNKPFWGVVLQWRIWE